MKRNQQVLWAMTELGEDLIEGARQYRAPRPLWRQLLPLAACLAVLLTVGIRWVSLGETPGQEAVSEKSQLLPLDLADIWNPEREAYYQFCLDSSDFVVTDGEGNLLAETRTGCVGLLWDDWNGESLGILQAEGGVLTVCDFQGQTLAELEAAWMRCFGDLAITYREDGQPQALYHVPSRQILMEEMHAASCHGDYLTVIPQNYELGRFAVYDRFGELLLSGTGTEEIHHSVVVDGTLYLGINDVKTGDVRIVDQNGTAVTDRTYPYDACWHKGFVWWSEDGQQRVLDLRTGQEVFSVSERGEPAETVSVDLVCEALILLRIQTDAGTRFRVVDWSGRQIVPDSVQVEWIDEEDDGMPELLACGNDGGGMYEVSYYTVDGTLVYRLPVTGTEDVISARTVLHVQPGAGITLIHLESGETLSQFAKPYTDAVPLWTLKGGVWRSTGMFYGCYTDEAGEERVDLLREDGTLILENLACFDSRELARQGGTPYADGGAFRVDGGLRHVDGTWLYRYE